MSARTGYWNGVPARLRTLRVQMPDDGPDEAWWTGPMPTEMAERFRRGFAELGLDIDPAAGSVDLRGQEVRAVEVTDAWGGVHVLYDGDGSGTAKVTNGRGSPRCGHRSIPSDAVEVPR